MNIYAGNLGFGVTEEELAVVFGEFGQVESTRVIRDRDSGRSRGFGFVEMPNHTEAQAAIEGLHDKEFNGRTLVVNEARPRVPR